MRQKQAGCLQKQSAKFPTEVSKRVRLSLMWQNVYSTVYSQAVTHPSTNTAQPCLTSVIRQELVYLR